ncbi:hypothetical protein N9954_00790 [Maribacter sp.]|nr:hypothetical protein [Maribacter sp.]
MKQVLFLIVFVFCTLGHTPKKAMGYSHNHRNQHSFDIPLVDWIGLHNGMGVANPWLYDELKAFPSAEGFGKYVTGGRGGAVLMVSNLDNTGEGSARRAWESKTPGYIIFETAGYINVGGREISPKDDKTVLGQSAFRNNGQGISFKMDMSAPHERPLFGNKRGQGFGNHSTRYIRYRRGLGILGECCGDNFTPWGTDKKFMIDHCSFAFSTDQNVSFPTVGGYTVQYSISAFGLKWATHQYNKPGNRGYPNGHSKGSLTSNTAECTWFGNLFANNDDRNPLIQAKATGITKVDITNNYFYNRGIFGIQLTSTQGIFNANIVNNFWKDGPQSKERRYGFIWPSMPSGTYENYRYNNPNYLEHRLFVKGNLSPKRPSSKNPDWEVVGAWDDNRNAEHPEVHQAKHSFDFKIDTASLLTASELEGKLLSHVGASLFRDSFDELAIDNAINNSGSIINGDGYTGDQFPKFTDFTGGYPPLSDMTETPEDDDKDGLENRFDADSDDYDTSFAFPNGLQVPDVISLTGSHNQVVPYYILKGQVWVNPGYEIIEVRYFNLQDIEALTLTDFPFTEH